LKSFVFAGDWWFFDLAYYFPFVDFTENFVNFAFKNTQSSWKDPFGVYLHRFVIFFIVESFSGNLFL
jgi:hypothetical protein